jgi:hypothetical protein
MVKRLMSGRIAALILAFVALAGWRAPAETINWFCDPGSTNLDSGGEAMDAGFRFEVGVFRGGFVPTSSNTADWAQHWTPAQRVVYNSQNQWFTGTATVTANPAPFIAGESAYIWGFRGSAGSGEWILFRNNSWEWPVPNPLNPFGIDWSAAAADQVVLGSIDADGAPFLMQSAAVAGVTPPSTTWAQWLEEQLAGETHNGEHDDPDGDSWSNLLEFALGSSPTDGASRPEIGIELVEILGDRFLRATIPRRIDHLVTLTVQVSSDLVTWSSGPSEIEVIDDGLVSLVVRDRTPASATTGRRFLRVQAQLAGD